MRQREIGVRRHRLTARFLIAAVACAGAAGALAGCSPGADYPSLFPAVHDMPPPRTDTTMDADQIQQATEALISERNRLSVEAGAEGKGQSKNPPAAAAASPAAKKPATPAAQSASAAATTAAGAGDPPMAIAPAAAAQTKP